jgi:hypothetical protein
MSLDSQQDPPSAFKLWVFWGPWQEYHYLYSGSKNCLDVWMFFTKVNNPTHLLTWALTCECMKESPYHRLSMGPRVKRIG